jgi:hypothetical protein
LRLEDGTLVGYAGITEACLPKEFHLPEKKVVQLHPKKTG